DRDDVRCADPRMRSLVTAEIDPVARARDAGDQGVDELLHAADEREHRAVVIRVRVHVEQPRLAGERRADHVDDLTVSALREVRDGLERRGHYRAQMFAHARHTDSGTTPARIRSAKTLQPTHRPNAASRNANTPSTATSANAAVWSPKSSASTAAETLNAAPTACANRLAGPGE